MFSSESVCFWVNIVIGRLRNMDIYSNSANNKRIAKNTAILYIRMLLTIGVTLYTSRVVLKTIGVEDFGIYNIVGGVVVLFSFLNNAMASATQRFLNFELGNGNEVEARRIFSMSMTTHIGIALLVLLASETIGLWFFYTQLNIPETKQTAACWVYQFSVLTCCVQIIRIPYNACIIAYEKMSFYAYMSIIEVLLKLLIVYLLVLSKFDKLVIYAILTCAVAIVVSYLYRLYCRQIFEICNCRFFWDKKLYKKLMTFSGWSLLGSVANVGAQQGLNILLNIFYGVTVNAAMGIANQLSSAIYSFVSNFQTAFNPQIVKSYASNEREYFMNLIFQASKYSFFLLFILSLPVIICCDFLLEVWLGVVPTYTVSFSRLILIFFLIEAISAPLWMSVQATGRIRNYQIIMCGMIMLNLPVAYLVLKTGMSPNMILVVRLIINILTYFVRIVYLKKKIHLPAVLYIRQVVIVAIKVVIVSSPLPFLISYNIKGWSGLFATATLALITTSLSIYFLGLKSSEKQFILSVLKSRILNRYK